MYYISIVVVLTLSNKNLSFAARELCHNCVCRCLSTLRRWTICRYSNDSIFNSLVPGRSESDSKNMIFNLVLLIGIFRCSQDNTLWWMPQDLTDDKSTLVQVTAWCRQATSHYLNQGWLRSLSQYGATRPQWVKKKLSFNYFGLLIVPYGLILSRRHHSKW